MVFVGNIKSQDIGRHGQQCFDLEQGFKKVAAVMKAQEFHIEGHQARYPYRKDRKIRGILEPSVPPRRSIML